MNKEAIAKNGFTLIELLLVMAIIGVMATLAMVNFMGVRERGRDAQRKADLAQIQAALELYRADKGSYPLSTGWGGYSTTGDTWISGLSPTYIKKLPKDPINSGDPGTPGEFGYYYFSDTLGGLNGGITYLLVTRIENENDSQAGKQVKYGTELWPADGRPGAGGMYTLTSP